MNKFTYLNKRTIKAHDDSVFIQPLNNDEINFQLSTTEQESLGKKNNNDRKKKKHSWKDFGLENTYRVVQRKRQIQLLLVLF